MKNENRHLILNKINLVEGQEILVNQKPVVEIKNLDVKFNRGAKVFNAVKNANLNIYENDIVGVVGESGSGKTTLGRSVLGLWDHASGEVRINGRTVPRKRIESVNKNNIWVYKNGQMIFQDPTSSLNRQSKVFNIVNEGLKNFKYVELEIKDEIEKYKLEIEKLNDQIKQIEDPKYAKKVQQEKLINEEIFKLIKKTKKKEFVEFVDAYAEFLKLNDQANEFDYEKEWLEKDFDNKIRNIKRQIRSDKFEIKENAQLDKEFLNKSKKDEINELRNIKKRYENNPDKVEKRINRRIDSFTKFILERGNSLSKKTYSDVETWLKNSSSMNVLKKNTVNLEKWLKNNDKKITIEDKNILSNLIQGLKIVEKKKDDLISAFNTRGFDFIYKFIDEKLKEKVNYFLGIIVDLDIRLSSEEIKLKKSKETIHIKFAKHSIDYLNEYKNILLSIVDEYRKLRVNYKIWLLEHEKTGINYFYKNINKANKMTTILQLSLVTWKGKHRVEYEKLRNEKLIFDLENVKKEVNEKISKLESKYPEDIKDIAFKILKTEIKKIKSTIKLNLSDFKYNEQIKTKKINELIFKISDYDKLISEKEKILKSKKLKREVSASKIIETLKLVGLSEEAINKYPSQFSGGQKQRIGIARTIITKPKFIIADEPISALDVSVQAQVINLLKDLHENMGLTMMFIAHDLQMVHYISNKIAVIYRGNIVEYGDADNVYKTPIHPYTKSLLNAMPSLENVGQPLKVSNYKWDDHNYNEFSKIKLNEVSKDHFVFGTEKEIQKWTKK